MSRNDPPLFGDQLVGDRRHPPAPVCRRPPEPGGQYRV